MAQIRFHLDEHIDLAIANGLSRRGIDVTTAHDAHFKGASDPTQLAYAHQQSRVFVTRDHDFLKLHSQGLDHSGIAFLAQQAQIAG